VAVSALAWLVGLGLFTAITMPLWQEGQPAWLTVLIGLLGAVVMAGAAAAVTGWGMLRLLDRAVPQATSAAAPRP
jgi:hypothetical protein